MCVYKRGSMQFKEGFNSKCLDVSRGFLEGSRGFLKVP